MCKEADNCMHSVVDCKKFLMMKLVLVIIVIFVGEFEVYCRNLDRQYPIIYTKPADRMSGRNSYFGYSVILHKDWVQIGAPRANSTILGEKVLEPGVVYRCKIKERCKEVELDRNANECNDDMTICHIKNNSWIGVAMAREQGEKGKVVVCGHRWINEKSRENDTTGKINTYVLSGICYSSKIYNPTEFSHKFAPLWPKEIFGNNSHGYFGSHQETQIGMSLDISPAPQNNIITLLIGAPGTGPYFAGGVAEYGSKPVNDVSNRRKRETRQPLFTPFEEKGFITKQVDPVIKKFSYFGYHVTSGSFFSKGYIYHAAGAPRDAEMKGSVLVFRVMYGSRSSNKEELPSVKKYYQMQGYTIGEYFGSSLAAADVTGDGLDELIVGAPLFSLAGDEGRIYIFTKDHGNTLLEISRATGSKPGGRFGTALTSLGDIDQDGHEDVAVGAPYEENGVVYIYNGNSRGMSLSQRIKASEIDHSLRGFGISISRPADIDGNKFTDVAVGSYLSQNVVVFRTYPTIELAAYIESYVKKLNIKDTKFVVKICLKYKGSINVPNEVGVVRHLDVDTQFHRFEAVPSVLHVLHENNVAQCEDITLMERKDKGYNRIEDIRIKLSQNLNISSTEDKSLKSIIWVNDSSSHRTSDAFCPFCPIVRKNEAVELVLPYIRDCGDRKCVLDVALQCRLLQNETYLNDNNFTIGSNPTIKLIIDISNYGDTRYSAVIKIDILKEVNIAYIPQICGENLANTSLSVTCNFGALTNGAKQSVNISLELSANEKLRDLLEKGEQLKFHVQTNSGEDFYDKNESNNICNMKLNLIMSADIDLFGKPQKDIYDYKNEGEEEKGREMKFSHTYEIFKVGVSPIRNVTAYVYVPVEWDGYEESILFSTLDIEAYQVTHSSDTKSLRQCTSEDPALHIEPGDRHSGIFLGELSVNTSLSDTYSPNRTLYVNCTSSDIKCKVFYCQFIEFTSTTTAKITVTITFNISALEPAMKQKNIISFSTHGHVEMAGAGKIVHPDIKVHHDVIVSTTFFGNLPDETIALWIIILCILAGIILIMLIVYGLVKLGFFKREKKEELKALKNSENCDQ